MLTLAISVLSVPLPLVTLQVWPAGGAATTTHHLLPLSMPPCGVNVIAPLMLLPLKNTSPSTRVSHCTVPVAPLSVPSMLKVVGATTMSEQVMATLVTLAVIVPLPLVTLQVWPAGGVRTSM